MIIGLALAGTLLLGSLAMYISFLYGETKGYEKGLDTAEQIALEVHAERIANVIHNEKGNNA